jgi:hypothetical protein
MSTTAAIKSTTLLPETAGLAEISPRKEDTRKNEETRITEITSNYLFNSRDILGNSIGFSGSSVADFGIMLNPVSLNIFVHDVETLGRPHNSFIGSISDEEAERMEKEVSLFKKRFDDDLTRRNKILFGE